MGRWFCFGKKDFCDDIENCFSCKFANGEGTVNEDKISLVLSKIFGEDYNLDLLKELVEADRNRLLKEQKTQTNADKIRSMTDEELYDFLCSFASRYTDISSPCAFRAKLFYVMGWLKHPAKED